jgi:hypothetical protein
MRNRVDIDHIHARVLCLEIGERLQACLREESELPASISARMERLRALDESPSIVPTAQHGGVNKPKDARREERPRPIWWRRKRLIISDAPGSLSRYSKGAALSRAANAEFLEREFGNLHRIGKAGSLPDLYNRSCDHFCNWIVAVNQVKGAQGFVKSQIKAPDLVRLQGAIFQQSIDRHTRHPAQGWL